MTFQGCSKNYLHILMVPLFQNFLCYFCVSGQLLFSVNLNELLLLLLLLLLVVVVVVVVVLVLLLLFAGKSITPPPLF